MAAADTVATPAGHVERLFRQAGDIRAAPDRKAAQPIAVPAAAYRFAGLSGSVAGRGWSATSHWRFSTVRCSQVLVDALVRDYPTAHAVIMCRAATLPIGPPRIECIALETLLQAAIGVTDPVALPPACAMEPQVPIRARFGELDRAVAGDA